jgi:predicted ArsR family transcriptional regulator
MDKLTFMKLTEVLGKEHNINILEEIYIKEWATATEIANELKVHVATAMRKLSELENIGLVKKRLRKGTNRPTYEYTLTSSKIDLSLDFAKTSRKKSGEAVKEAERMYIRENANPDIVFEMNEKDKVITKVNLMQKTVGGLRKKVEKSLSLTELEGRFLWKLPFKSEPGKSIIEICLNSNIKKPSEIKKILKLVDNLKKLKVIEIVN